MKTLFIALEFPPAVGGVETYYEKLAHYWPEPLMLLTNKDKALISPFLPIFGWLRGLFRVKAIISAHKVDWALAGEILPLGIILYILSFFYQFKYAIILHGLDFSLARKNARKSWITKKILARADLVVCANSFTASEVKTFLSRVKRVEVINPGVEIDKTRAESVADTAEIKKADKKTFELLTIGRLVKRKGIDMTLQALALVHSTLPNLHYTIIGQGPEKESINTLIQKLNLQKIVTCVSGATDTEKEHYLKNCDVFIMPTRNLNGDYEGFGIVYLEAGLYKKPVIAGRGGGVSDAVRDNVNGLMVDGDKPEEIAAAIIRLYQDENLRVRLGEAGYQQSLQSSWPERMEKFYSLLS